MKILSVSDRIIDDLINPNVPLPGGPVDLILGCGDLPPEYLRELRSLYNVPLLYILGNHDIRHQSVPAGCTDITGKITTIDGKSFLGFSGSRWYNGGQNQYREREMRAQIRQLWFQLWRLKKLDVVITHAPPRHIHDAEDRCHKGFNCYRYLIKRHTPKYFIHGHIHAQFESPSDRISTLNKTQVINSYGRYTFEI
ncbi:MAG: metallophosphoesterase [Deltaproteobacteria bacterium]|nr:metallophosphoesterase [Deltaproteobacteria bacterium]